MSDVDEKNFDKAFAKVYDETAEKFGECVNIAIVGKVSAGKSSLLNAFLERDPGDPIAAVGAGSGVTTKVTAYTLDDDVLIYDCPGLDDVRRENTEATKVFLKHIDVGLFVVTGSCDARQKENFDDLRRNCEKVFLILNKIDEWDDLSEEALTSVCEQWRVGLGAERIYPTCAKGYDPARRPGAATDFRGVKQLKEEVYSFLQTQKKGVLLARHLKSKEDYANTIIYGATAASGGAALVPGSAVYITAIQAASLASLNYLYTGKVLSRQNIISLMPQFAAQSIGRNLFLWAKSILPPTGVLDAAAAAIASGITFSMLASFKWFLKSGHSLEDFEGTASLMEMYNAYKAATKGMSVADLADKKLTSTLLSKPPSD